MSKLVPIKYRIDQSAGKHTGENREVEGFAFETPGWPEFHGCVRRGSRFYRDDGIFDDWIIDHFETGLSVSAIGYLSEKEDAPAALAKRLKGVGKRKVHKALRKFGLKP